MKNLFRFAMAVAVIFSAASCAKEDISSSIGGGEVEVTFTANLAGLGTRAIADGNTVNRVYLAIFDAKAKTYLGELTVDAGYPVSNGLATIPVVLLKDKEYDLVFWAQKDGTGAYTLDLAKRQVKVNYGAEANNEARDAFFKISNKWTAGKDNTTFDLRRPFAQINVGNSDADLKAITANGSTISQSSMSVVTKVKNTLLLTDADAALTGEEVAAEFTLANIPTETIANTVDPTHDATLNASAEYNYLAMNYLLVAGRQVVDLTFNFFDGTTTYERKYFQVPVQRNYRTNILGQIISSPMDFTVEIKPGFDGDNNEMQVATAADFINAFANIKDGGTVTLQSNINFTEEDRTNSGGTWYEGVYYVGDKSFTIDLNGKTITNTDGAVNDYMFLFKNEGEKANTITFKNGTIDAGTAAYCALCTSTTSTQKITINLDNVNLIGNNSNGAVAKIRGGAELNVNAGTVITGKDSYVGIEAFGNGTVVNIKEGAKIYQNGTSSYAGSLAGASGNATLNVLGGEGVSAQGGFIAMTSGGTINISGGNWTANTNGAYANSNKSVLISQSDKGAKCTVNVTGGTFKGGYNCYGNAVGDAQINITGGNFNADPTSHVEDGYKAVKNGETWTVYENIEASDATEFVAALAEGGMVTLQNDITLPEALTLPAGVILNGNGRQINGSLVAGGDVTFVGHTKVTAFSAGYYNRTITIGEGACLEVTGTGRVSLAYGNTFDITGNVADAKTADKSTIQPSLIIPGGISITGGNDAVFNIKNAYVQIGSTSSKPGAANGTFTLNVNNSIAEFTKEFAFYDPTGGVNPTFKLNVKNSVLTTVAKMYLTAKSVVTVDNSNLSSQYFANRGVVNVTNGSVLTSATIQFGENGGNSGTITVDNSKFTITTGNSKANAYDGKGDGSITAKNGATVTVDYYKDMTINADSTSTFTGTEVQ